jgi:hypothetical protein
MKKIIKSALMITFFMICTSSLYAQDGGGSGRSIRVNLYGSYAFEDGFDSYYDYGNYYQGTIEDGFQYGGGIEVEMKNDTYLEILYLREDTNAPTQYYNGGLYDKYANFDIALNYIMLGGNKYFGKPGSSVQGFGGFMAGVGIVNVDSATPSVNFSESATKFAWGLKAGAVIWTTDVIGIKLQGQMLSIAQSVGGGVYFGTGGAGAGVSSYSSLYQFTLGGGLVFELGN